MIQIAKYEKTVVRYLGMHLDKQLCFKHHIEVILRPKLVGLLYAMKYISRFTRLEFRRSFLFSILQNLFWPLFYIASISDTQKKALECWYNKFVRATVRAPDFVDTLTCRKIIGIESFSTGTVRMDARETIDFLSTERHDLIKGSLYKLNLTKLRTLKDENVKISDYIESHRNRWNFIPEALKENVYSIGEN